MKTKSKKLPFKLNAKMDKNKVVIKKNDFEHILLCLATQKFVGEPPPCGDAMAMSKKEYLKSQKEMQGIIDNCYNQCENFLHKNQTFTKQQIAFVKKHGYGG